jgi:GDPmannose 4,6-dehydratase
MSKRALVTGVTGQDGAYLCRLLLEKGYEVFGAHRRSATLNLWRLEELGVAADVRLVPLDLIEFTNVLRTIEQVRPDELYNLAAQSFVGLSFEQPIYTADVDGIGPMRILECLRVARPECRFYQASTSEMFGKVAEIPQTERTPFHPRSPYGVAKLHAHWITINYRESWDLFACSGLLFNHESPLRGIEFVTRKLTSSLARMKHGSLDVIEVGNLDASRDWGFAGDYVEAMHLMLQQEQADDYVVATGETHSVAEFVERAIELCGWKPAWEGEGEGRRCLDAISGRVLVRVNPALYRPAEVDLLIGDASKARRELGWKPRVGFSALVESMVRADLDRITSHRPLQ